MWKQNMTVEDRGQHYFVWYDTQTADDYSFSPFYYANSRVEISVPIGWRLVQDSDYGTMIENVFGQRLLAEEAVACAKAGENGFMFIFKIGPN